MTRLRRFWAAFIAWWPLEDDYPWDDAVPP